MADSEKRQPNKDFAKNEDFVKACEKAEIPATARQASKFRRGFGKAFSAKNQ